MHFLVSCMSAMSPSSASFCASLLYCCTKMRWGLGDVLGLKAGVPGVLHVALPNVPASTVHLLKRTSCWLVIAGDHCTCRLSTLVRGIGVLDWYWGKEWGRVRVRTQGHCMEALAG
jgi:hypothetical protein